MKNMTIHALLSQTTLHKHRLISQRAMYLLGVSLMAPWLAAIAQTSEAQSSMEASVAPQGAAQVSENMEEVIVKGSYSSNVFDLGVWNAPVREIPQSVTVITEQNMKDQNMQNLSDALQTATGVTVQSFGSGTASFLIRGFSTNTISIDGVRTSASSGGTHGHGTPDLIHYQSVEVIRGPAGLLEGAGEPGGYVNMSRKRARADREVTLKGYTQSWGGYRGEIDATGALNASGSLRGRVALGYEDSDSFIDEVFNEKQLGYATLEYDVSDKLSLAAGAIYEDVNVLPDVGVPTYADGFADLDRELYTGSPFNSKNSELSRQFAEARYAFANGIEVVATVTNTDSDFDYVLNYTVTPISRDTGLSGRFVITRDEETSEQSYDVHATIPFTLANREHSLIVGANGLFREDDQFSLGGGPYPAVNVFDPGLSDNPDPAESVVESPGQRIDTDERGFYVKSTLALTEAATVILGARFTETWKTDNGVTTSEINDEVTPYIGFVYDLNRSMSLYASVAESFAPQTARTIENEVLEPRVGEQYELGLKGELYNKRANYHVAIYELTDNNRAIPDRRDFTFSIAGGEVRVRGFEAEISGTVSESLQLLAGYAYTDTETVRDFSPELEGEEFSPATPEHSVKFWGRYDINPQWSTGLGFEFSSGEFTQFGPLEQGNWTTVSLMAAYQPTDSVRFVANAKNITDEEYYSRVSGAARQNYFGDPRQFELSVEVSF
ncbi:MAG: TonB-dependent siderophore receptor [Pseudomonadota bacterium]